MATPTAVLIVAVGASYWHLRRKERHRHETGMLREQRDAELLANDQSYIDREPNWKKDRHPRTAEVVGLPAIDRAATR